MRENRPLPTQPFSALFRATELEDRIEFWGVSQGTVTVGQSCGPAGCTTTVTGSITIVRQ